MTTLVFAAAGALGGAGLAYGMGLATATGAAYGWLVGANTWGTLDAADARGVSECNTPSGAEVRS